MCVHCHSIPDNLQGNQYLLVFLLLSWDRLGPPTAMLLHPSPISRSEFKFRIAWGIIKRNLNIPTPPSLLYT